MTSKIQRFFHDLEADLNSKGILRAVVTLYKDKNKTYTRKLRQIKIEFLFNSLWQKLLMGINVSQGHILQLKSL